MQRKRDQYRDNLNLKQYLYGIKRVDIWIAFQMTSDNEKRKKFLCQYKTLTLESVNYPSCGNGKALKITKKKILDNSQGFAKAICTWWRLNNVLPDNYENEATSPNNSHDCDNVSFSKCHTMFMFKIEES